MGNKVQDVALINSVDPASGIGRYAESLHRNFSKEVQIDHFYIDKSNHSLYVRKLHGADEFITRSRITSLIPGRPGEMLSVYNLARQVPSNYDLYHIADQNMAGLCYHPRFETTLLTVHDLDYVNTEFDSVSPAIGRILYRGIKSADHIITVSKSTKQDVLNQYAVPEKDVSVVHNGVSRDFTPPDKKERQLFRQNHGLESGRYIVNTDQDRPRKNIETLLKVLQQLKQNGLSDIKLLRTKPLERSSEVADKLGVEEMIEEVGYIKDQDLPVLYGIGDVFVTTSMYEGFGLPPLEAMAAGTPVVSSNASSLPEVVGDAGLLNSPNDISGLTQDILTILNKKECRVEYKKRGLNRAEKFSWDTTANRTQEIIANLI